MRTPLAAALVFFSLIGSAQAGAFTAAGAVKALTNINQVNGIVGTANFDEGPTSGNVPANLYAAQGLTWASGNFPAILAGVTTPGYAYNPSYGTYASYFLGPIGGGGSQSGQTTATVGGVATFSGNNITQIGLTASPGSNQYLTAWGKTGKILGQITWVPSGLSEFVGIDTQGVPIGMVAYGNDDVWAGMAYDVSGPFIISDTWVWATGKCTNDAQCDDQNVCTTDVCDVAKGICGRTNNTLSCSDGNSCTQNDVCSAGACVPGTAVTCSALDSCHAVGVCNPMTGACSNPNKPDNSACSDSNACTQTDTCQAGVCTGQSPVVCPAPDACHTAGSCNMQTGKCTNPAKADGTACNDSNACTTTDSCQAGVCTGQNPVVCAASDACHAIGLCDTVTGTCSNPAKPNGSSCDDGNGCTQGDICQAGSCTGQSIVTCPPANDCQVQGVCDPTVGACVNTSKPDGTACEDGTACTQGDVCQAGACLGGTAVVCAALDACHDVGTCDAKSGMCSNPAKEEGSSCDDGTACTQGDTCVQGTCTSGPPVVCAALDKCHDVGTCNTATGQCSNPLKEINCSAKTVCEQNGVCDPQSGACINAAKPDGIPCGKGICIAGTCSDEAGNTTSSTGSGSTTTTGSTSTGASTGVGGSGAGGAGGAGPGAGGASGGTGVGGSSATGISGPGATSTGNGAGNGDGTITPAGGCGCSTPGTTAPARAPWLLLGLLLPALRRRRSR
jgi:MYXO-CTERM domain-containing protein